MIHDNMKNGFCPDTYMYKHNSIAKYVCTLFGITQTFNHENVFNTWKAVQVHVLYALSLSQSGTLDNVVIKYFNYFCINFPSPLFPPIIQVVLYNVALLFFGHSPRLELTYRN